MPTQYKMLIKTDTANAKAFFFFWENGRVPTNIKSLGINLFKFYKPKKSRALTEKVCYLFSIYTNLPVQLAEPHIYLLQSEMYS